MNFQNLQYFPLTWVDGMFLNTGHFQHTENYIEEALRDTRQVALYTGNYGLLPNALFQLTPTNFSTGQVELKLHACRAILPTGHRVEILSQEQRGGLPYDIPTITFTPIDGVVYDIYLCVDALGKTAVGLPVERPLRNPYWMPKLYLEIAPKDQICNNNSLKIGEWKHRKLESTFIPPNLVLAGNKCLREAHQECQNIIVALVETAMSIITKSNDPMRIQFSQSLIQILQNQLGTYQWQLPYQSPLAWVAHFGNIAYSIDALLKMSNKDFVKTALKDDYESLSKSIAKLIHWKFTPELMREAIELINNVLGAIKATLDTLLKPSLSKVVFVPEDDDPKPKPWFKR